MVDEQEIVQTMLVGQAMEKSWIVSELGGATGRGNRRTRLLKRLEEKKEQINSLARDLVALMGPPEAGEVHPSEVLEIRKVVGEPLAMYYVDSNIPVGFIVQASTAELAREGVKRSVGLFRDQNYAKRHSRMHRAMKPFVNGKEVVIGNVFYVCDLREAIFGETGDGNQRARV